MEDNKPILKDGTGTPYIAIFNSRGKPIIDPKNKIPIGMNVYDWWYEYNEEKEDSAEIALETDNPNLVDHPDLNIQSTINMQWGYIYADGTSHCGPVRTVIIRDTNVEFGTNGTRLVLICTDSFATTKTTPADMEEKAFIMWVKNNIQGKFFVEIIDHTTNTQLYIKPVIKKQPNAQQDK